MKYNKDDVCKIKHGRNGTHTVQLLEDVDTEGDKDWVNVHSEERGKERWRISFCTFLTDGKAQEGSAVVAINPEQFGKDHWSLLAYVETRCVDYQGVLDRAHMRCNENHHPLLKGTANPLHCGMGWEEGHGTRLKGYWKEDGTTSPSLQLSDHDDWDCLDDLKAAGNIDILSMINGFVIMTKKGNVMAGHLRTHKTAGAHYATFEPQVTH